MTQAAKAEARKAERASADRKAGGGNAWWERKAKAAEETTFEKADWLDESRRVELVAERRGILSWIKARRREEGSATATNHGVRDETHDGTWRRVATSTRVALEPR